MPISEEAKRTLHELGLTEYETRAYLTLIEGGTMTAGHISETAEVPYSKIYETLNSLEKKGWIEIEKNKPSKYYPKPPTEALEAAKLRFESTMKAWEQTVLKELQPLYERREIREKPDIWIIRGEFNILVKLREMLNTVKKELMVAIPILPETLVEIIYPILIHQRDMGVETLLMVSQNVEKKNIERISDVAEVRVRDRMFGGGIIANGREAMLLLGEEPNLVIWSDHMGLVKFAKDYFQYLWNSEGSIKWKDYLRSV